MKGEVESRAPRALLAVLVAMMLVVPAAFAIPVERPSPDRDPSEGSADGTDPLTVQGGAVERVPPSQRPWLVRAHEMGHPYPPDLVDTLAPLGIDDVADVLVQFEAGTDEDDLALLDGLGLDLVHRFVGVDACHVSGPVGRVWALVDSGRTWYVEPEREIVRDMDLSTSVINATRVWATRIQQEMATPTLPVDGRGVTCVVVDTGIDASHPDLDYGQKVLYNLRSDTGEGPYYEIENSDLGYGHGTHVAGTVAGNGDASAGARRGVAPGANLVGITVDTDNNIGYVGALDWVWRNSRPDNNPQNIRLLTNSWHSTVVEYDPQAALCVLINAMAHENNVISTWSAGNDGRNDPNGDALTTSGQGNTPVGIMVAAYQRDGSGVADFSSRGKRGDTHTYPDIGGPGVNIWSCSARRTVISGASYVGGNQNPYYLAISGTSMSTPHIAGLASLLWQAAPSLTLSAKHEDHSGDPGDWFEREDTLIHEIEWIIEATATFLEGEGLGSNGIPERDDELDGFGVDGEPIDYVQGYGIVHAERAVAVALTLQRLRVEHPDWNITVADALKAYEAILQEWEDEHATDSLWAAWSGEYSRYNDQEGNVLGAQNQTKLVWVPEGTERVDIELRYATLNLVDFTAATITWTVDFGFDGSIDAQGDLTPTLDGARSGTVAAGSHAGQVWALSVLGQGFKVIRPLQDRNYVEVRVEYTMSVAARLSTGAGAIVVSPAGYPWAYYVSMAEPWEFGTPSGGSIEGTVVLPRLTYNLTRVVMESPVSHRQGGDADGGVNPWWLLLAVVMVVVGMVIIRRRWPHRAAAFRPRVILERVRGLVRRGPRS